MQSMKKIILYILVGWMGCLLPAACIDDETTGFRTDGSPITITVKDTVLYQDFGIPLVIEPDITQTQPELPLKYEWRAIAMDKGDGSDSLVYIGSEKTLNYRFPRSGVFRIRLRVENQYGSSFSYFMANIRAPFEQGLLVLSNNEQDAGRISFVRLKEENELFDKTEQDFNLDAFGQANSGIALQGARDLILTQVGNPGDHTYYAIALSSETDRKIYFLNIQYFLVENVVEVATWWPGVKPTYLFGNTRRSMQSQILFATKDEAGNPGDYGVVDLRSFLAYRGGNVAADSRYDKVLLGRYDWEGWDESDFVACLIDNTHARVNAVTTGGSVYAAGDHFAGERIVNASFMGFNGALAFVTTRADRPGTIRIHKSTSRNMWDDGGGLTWETDPYEYTLDGELNLPEDCQMCCNEKYQHIYYYAGNRIYRWVYKAQEPKLPTEPDLILPDAGDEITYIGLSEDEQHLYVCVYNPAAKTELKGKLLVVNADRMTIEKTFSGIADRPVKVLWKPAM